jgi:hypothetical protein
MFTMGTIDLMLFTVMLDEMKIGDLVAVRGFAGDKQRFGIIVRVAYLRDTTPQYWVRLAPQRRNNKVITYPFIHKQLEMLSCA